MFAEGICVFAIVYMVFGILLGIDHVNRIKDIIDESLNKKKLYEEMVQMHGTSPAGAEYYVLLQDLMITDKEIFDEEKQRKHFGLIWYMYVLFPFVVAWPYYIYSMKK